MFQRDGHRLSYRGSVCMLPKISIEVQLTELSPVDHVKTVGVPAWTEVGTLVKATFWARADTTKVRPRTILFEKSIFSDFL